MFLLAVLPVCSPSCGVNALCQKGACTCESGYQGDGYNCSGKCIWCFLRFASVSVVNVEISR